MKSNEIPKFGPLSGVKVISSGSNVAGPYAASMMADFGAEVIFLESTLVKDMERTTDTKGLLNKERRNHRTIALNTATPEGKEVFLKLIKDADIFIENSKAKTWDKWGLSDEVIWQVNPKLVIAHVTGYGQYGDPKIVSRGSFDAIGQAFSGYMNINGEPEVPSPAPAYMGDYVTAITASWACLAAYINAQKTGKGESVDVAQFEVLLMIQGAYPADWFNDKKARPRAGAKHPAFAGWEPFQCKDGMIYIQFINATSIRKGLPLLGLEYGTELFPEGSAFVYRGTPGGDLLLERLTKFCAERTVTEAEDELNSVGVASSAIMTYEKMLDHPHYVARSTFTEWDGIEGRKIKGPSIAPKLQNNPGKIWRTAPHYGKDNEDILEELGYTAEQIEGFYNNKILNRDENY